MTNKVKIGLAVAVLLTTFTAGRYSAQSAKVATKIDTTVTEDKKSTQDKHKQTTTITEKKPDGTTKTVTKVTEDTETKKDTTTDSVSHTQQVVTPVKSSLNISALAGLDLSGRLPVYGVSINKQVLGPVTLGAYGLTNGVIGVSIGLNF